MFSLLLWNPVPLPRIRSKISSSSFSHQKSWQFTLGLLSSLISSLFPISLSHMGDSGPCSLVGTSLHISMWINMTSNTRLYNPFSLPAKFFMAFPVLLPRDHRSSFPYNSTLFLSHNKSNPYHLPELLCDPSFRIVSSWLWTQADCPSWPNPVAQVWKVWGLDFESLHQGAQLS